MEKRSTIVKGERPYYFALDLIKQKTSLKEDDAILFFDLLILFIKKHLLYYRSIKILSFGKISLKYTKKKGIKVRFSTARFLKLFITNKKPHNFKYCPRQTPSLMTEISAKISKILLIDRKEIAFLINIFFFSLVEELIKNRIVKVRFFAYFYLARYNFKEMTIFGKKRVALESVQIDPIKSFRKEINNKTTQFRVTDRVKRVFSKFNMTNEIKLEEFL